MHWNVWVDNPSQHRPIVQGPRSEYILALPWDNLGITLIGPAQS